MVGYSDNNVNSKCYIYNAPVYEVTSDAKTAEPKLRRLKNGVDVTRPSDKDIFAYEV